jgi:hypothetical protein
MYYAETTLLLPYALLLTADYVYSFRQRPLGLLVAIALGQYGTLVKCY